MDKKEKITQKNKVILDHLDFAKKEANSFVHGLPENTDRRIICALWYEKFSSLLSEQKKTKKNLARRIMQSGIKCISNFSRPLTVNTYKTDFLFLYSYCVHQDIVKELISTLKKNHTVTEIEESTSGKLKRIEYFIKGIKYTVKGMRYLDMIRDIEAFPLSEKLYLSLVHYLGIITSYRPQIVITFNESSPNAGLTSYVCRLTGAISVNIAHAIVAKTPFYQNSPYDYYLVYGEKSKQNIEENEGIINGKVVAIGALKMDEFFKNQYHRDKFTKKILIVGSWKGHFLDEAVNNLYAIVSEAVKNIEDITFLYKPHPLEVGEKNVYSRKFYRMRNCVVLQPDSDLLTVLKSVDMVILGWSAVGLEGAILGKPVIVVNPGEIPDWLFYVESGFGVEVSSAEEMRIAITKIYDNYDYYAAKAREFVNLHLSNQGTANAETHKFLITILKK